MREEEFSVGTEKRSSLFGCLFRLATVAVAVYGAITAAKKVLARLTRRLEEGNEGNEAKRYLVGLGIREICPEETVSGVDLTVVGGCAELDLQDAEISGEVFVKVRALGGKIVIKVPAMVRVELDGKGVVCGCSNQVPSYENESLPVAYVDAACVGACVKVVLGEE